MEIKNSCGNRRCGFHTAHLMLKQTGGMMEVKKIVTES
jgi:hypothetical protein